MSERLVIPVPIFAALMLAIILTTALGAYVTPVGAILRWRGVFWGIMNAIFVATLGYLKMAKPEEFDPVKFLVTVVVGAISGYLAFWVGLDPRNYSSMVCNHRNNRVDRIRTKNICSQIINNITPKTQLFHTSYFRIFHLRTYELERKVVACMHKSSFVSLLADAESRFRNKFLVVHCGGLSKREIDWLRSAHYHMGIQTYGTIVVKSLREHINLQSVKSLFGVDKGLFRMGSWDST